MTSLKDKVRSAVTGQSSYYFSKKDGIEEIRSTGEAGEEFEKGTHKNSKRNLWDKKGSKHGGGLGGGDDNDHTHLVNYEDTHGHVTEKGGMAKASYNMINSIIGAGIIGIPYAVREAGFIFGSVLLFFMALITDYSLRILVESGLLVGISSYQGVMQHLFGKPGFILLSICQFCYPLFAMVGYTVIVGDTIPKVLEQLGASGIVVNEMFIKAMATLLIMWPVSLYRHIAKLGKISFLAIIFILFLCVAVIIRTSVGSTADADVPSFVAIDSHIPESMAIMVFAFMCHHNTFLIYNSIENATMRRYSCVTHISVFTAACVAYMLAVAGYYTFRGIVQSDLLENYCVDDALVNVARIGYAFVVMFTYPIEMFVCREVLSLLVAYSRGTGKPPKSYKFHFASTLITGAVILAAGLPVSKLGVVLEFSGSLFGTPLAFIFPPALYLRASKESWKSANKIKASLLLAFGVALTILGTVQAIRNAVEGGITEHLDRTWCEAANLTLTATTPVPATSVFAS